MRDPLEDWIRKDAALAGTFSVQQACVDRTRPVLQLAQVGKAPLAAEVTGRVHDGLNPQGALVFEVLLDPRMFVEGVDGDLGAAGDDFGLELRGGVGADPPVEDDLDSVRAAQIKIVSDQRLEEAAGVTGGVEHDRAGHLDLGHRQLPPVAGQLVGGAQRQRQPG